jgi:hypothetical protein
MSDYAPATDAINAIGHTGMAGNFSAYQRWIKKMNSKAAAQHPNVARILARKPGSRLPPLAAPFVGVGGVTNDTLAEFNKTYVRRCSDLPNELLRLHAFILDHLDPNARSVENQALWEQHDLGVPQPNVVHHLLHAIELAFANQGVVPEERMDVDAIRRRPRSVAERRLRNVA